MGAVYRTLSYLLPLLALLVIMKGAYVRLSDAGLGCPDWPGCYGHVVVPGTEAEISDPRHLAARPLETGKAWREMIHRYLASTLGLLMVGMSILTWLRRRQGQRYSPIAFWLVPLVVLQGALGMWTVTLLLKPLVVVAHLLGGFTLVALSWWHLLDVRGAPRAPAPATGLRAFALLALGVLGVQIFLGGWTSANYAALACTDFPTCQGRWWPAVDFRAAFVLWRGLGQNYEYGVLDTPARTAIHMTHRCWAMVVAAVLLSLFAHVWRVADARGRRIGWYILALLAVQVALGITNVVRGLPLPVAVMHNGVAAGLALSLVSLVRYASPAPETRLPGG
jgi:cytochrome c oxidase assembly protein subunit 15